MENSINLTPEQIQLAGLFFKRSLSGALGVAQRNGRFVHYTTAEVAYSILRSRSVWMRNALTMNDFSEIQHGLNCLVGAYNGPVGERMKKFLDELHPGFSADLEKKFNDWIPGFQVNTYLTCMSEHDDSEDLLGRLSMWRAYGGENGVALVLNNTPFMATNSGLGAVSSPVAYLDQTAFAAEFDAIITGWVDNVEFLRSLPYEHLLGNVFPMMRYAILCTKHPGFAEEREWRIIHSPLFDKSEHILVENYVVNGIPQQICKIPLKNDPGAGLVGADPKDLLSRLIVGPTQYPAVVKGAFINLLNELGIDNAEEKVILSDIPLRR